MDQSTDTKATQPVDSLLFWSVFLFLLSCFIWYHYDLFHHEQVMEFINSDTAIIYLMAQELLDGHVPIFFWGQNYMGPLTSGVIALNQLVLDYFHLSYQVPYYQIPFKVAPMAGIYALMEMFVLGLTFYTLTFRKIWGTWPALFSCAFLIMGGSLLVEVSFLTLGTEMAFLLGGLLLYQFLRLKEKRTRFNLFIFGLLIGFSWWMNQTVVFILLPLAFMSAANDPLYKRIRTSLSKSTLLDLSYYTKQGPLKEFFRFVNWVAGINLFWGIFLLGIGGLNGIYWGIRIKIGSGTSAIRTSLKIWLVLHLILLTLEKRRVVLFVIKKCWKKQKFLIFGLVLGYSPVLLGKYLHWYDKFYAPKFEIPAFPGIPHYWFKLFTEYLPNLYFNTDPFGPSLFLRAMIYSIFLVALAYLFIKHKKPVFHYLLLRPGQYSLKGLAWGVFYFNILYIMLSARTGNQISFPYRYAILTMPFYPILLYSIYRGLESWFKDSWVKRVSFLAFLSFLFVLSILNTFKTAHRYQTMDRQTRSELKRLKDSGYKICYADYWQAYRFEYLSQGQIQFIPYNSQDRTPERSKRLADSAVPKCLYRPGKEIAPF